MDDHLDSSWSVRPTDAAITAYLGFEVDEGEYKVMGLAAYGKPRYRAEFEKLIRLSLDGTFELSPTSSMPVWPSASAFKPYSGPAEPSEGRGSYKMILINATQTLPRHCRPSPKKPCLGSQSRRD